MSDLPGLPAILKTPFLPDSFSPQSVTRHQQIGDLL